MYSHRHSYSGDTMKRLVLIACLFVARLALCQSITVSPLIVANNSTGNTISVSCIGATTGANAVCNWTPGTPGTPAFSVLTGYGTSGCSPSITAQTVNSVNSATLTLSAGSCN